MEEQLESWNILAHLGTSWFWSIFSHVSLVQSCSHLQSSHLKESHIIALLPCTRGFFTSSSLRWVVSWSVSSWEPREKTRTVAGCHAGCHGCHAMWRCDLQGLPGRVEAFPEDGDGTLAAARGNRDGQRMSKNVKEHEGTGEIVFFSMKWTKLLRFFRILDVVKLNLLEGFRKQINTTPFSSEFNGFQTAWVSSRI